MCLFTWCDHILQREERLVDTDSSPVKQHEGKKSRELEGKLAVTNLFSDESSESVISVRSEENISNKGSPVKKPTVACAAQFSEPFEASTEEVFKYNCMLRKCCIHACCTCNMHTYTCTILQEIFEGSNFRK